MRNSIGIEDHNVVNEWNMVGGYYEQLYRLLKFYYDASLTPDGYDDLEALKRVLDHLTCKIFASKSLTKTRLIYYNTDMKVYSDNGNAGIVDYLDKAIISIENTNYEIADKKRRGIPLSQDDLVALSNSKKLLRKIHREILVISEELGMFRKDRYMHGKHDFMDDLGGE